MEKLYKVQMNSKGAPDFSTAVEVPSSDNHDWEKYSDKLWKLAYERGKEDEKRWWSGYCANCTDADRTQGEWIWDKDGMDWNIGAWICSECHARNANLPGYKKIVPLRWSGSKFCPNCGADMRKGKDDESK